MSLVSSRDRKPFTASRSKRQILESALIPLSAPSVLPPTAHPTSACTGPAMSQDRVGELTTRSVATPAFPPCWSAIQTYSFTQAIPATPTVRWRNPSRFPTALCGATMSLRPNPRLLKPSRIIAASTPTISWTRTTWPSMRRFRSWSSGMTTKQSTIGTPTKS